MEPTFNCLTGYETGAAMAAICAVSLCDKPIAEVGNVKLQQSQLHLLEEDLRRCIDLADKPDVKCFVMATADQDRWSYGFYRQPWAWEALKFIDQEGRNLPDFHRDWIVGLLFGYTPSSIEEYVRYSSGGQDATSQHGDAVDRVGISRLC